MTALSLAKSYFPLGKTVMNILECTYEKGWRVIAAPNFGGQGDSWPCFVFRRLKDASSPPELLFGSIKDSNIPGKICLSGPSAAKVGKPMMEALKAVPDNAGVTSEKDSYDDDHDVVLHNVHITNGMGGFSLKLPYFPRCDSMVAVLNAAAAEGFAVAACPNFGGMEDSWPSFIFEKDPYASPPLILAVKDDNIPGKLNLGGANIGANTQLTEKLLSTLKTLCGESVQLTKDDYDRSFDLCFKNTKITSGSAGFTFAKPFWPHGYVVEAVLGLLHQEGCNRRPELWQRWLVVANHHLEA
ncbi:unnamed protein product [Polarella glacialis]|uniref:Uncharacterized protein n=1 Tax=Polarella glacialis TaxID=89957 RepID=A0A813HM39_POLGL|nr:unnamed protein product [Polarella glacialis]CAE8682404.1 unnamed protein product [Polarella glacialis]